MSDDYKKAKLGKLKLKTPDDIRKRKRKEKKAKKRKHDQNDEDREDCAGEKFVHEESVEFKEDFNAHAGWWKCADVSDLREICVIEFEAHEFCYVHCLDDGSFTLGLRTPEGNPLPQEQFTPVPVGENRFAFKTGFGRYLTVEKDGILRGTSEAYGPNETFEPVWQGKKCALQAVGVNMFLKMDEKEQLVAIDKTASDEHMLSIRCDRDKKMERKQEKLAKMAKEEHGTLLDAEKNYARKFQSWVGGSLLLNSGKVSDLKKARNNGTLHSELLGRRQKMKNDKYCK